MRFQLVMFSSLLLAAGVSTAETERQLASHEHSAQKINFAIQDKRLYIELFAPAHDVVGFEHTPSAEEQKHAVKVAIEALEHDGSIFLPSKNAGCQLQRVKAQWKGGEAYEDHEEHEEHEEHAAHSEFEAKYQFECNSIADLEEIEVGVFNLYPGVQRIDVQGLLSEGQMAVTLRPNSNKIVLNP